MNFKETKALADAIEYPHLLSVQDVTWSRYGDEIYWVDENYSVYSSCITEGNTMQQDMFICNADTGCGYWMTHVFRIDREIDFSEFENLYRDHM